MRTWEPKIAKEALDRIEHYRKKKENNIFDDFYKVHLDFMVKCINFYLEHYSEPGSDNEQQQLISG